MTKEQHALYELISDALQYKDAGDDLVEFYWDSLLKPELSEQGLKWALDEFTKKRVIVLKKRQYEENPPQPTRTRLLNATRTHPRAVYTYAVDREKLKALTKPAKAKLFVAIPKTREVVINGEYILAKPNFASENDEFIGFAVVHPNTRITKEMLRDAKLSIQKKFAQIISDLGFEGELKKAFFPNISIQAVEFRNDLTDADLKELGVDANELEKQLIKLRRIDQKETEVKRKNKK